jgi:hypothetical protein
LPDRGITHNESSNGRGSLRFTKKNDRRHDVAHIGMHQLGATDRRLTCASDYLRVPGERQAVGGPPQNAG